MDDIIKIDEELKYYIELVEIDKENKEALDKVTVYFIKLLECIKIALIEKKERYYGYIFMNFNVEINYHKIYNAGVSIDTNPFTMIVNPLLLGKYKIKEIIYIICHEIEHLVLEHPAEGLKYNPTNEEMTQYILNLCMDASVNDRLDLEIKEYNLDILSEPKGAITSYYLSGEYRRNFRELESFLYYFNILKPVMIIGEKPGKNGTPDKDGKSKFAEENQVFEESDENEDGIGGSGGDGPGYIIVRYGESCNGIVTKKDLDEKKKVFVISTNDDNSEEARTKIKQFLKDIIEGIPTEFRGLFPSHEQVVLDRLLAPPKINWKQLLKKYIGIVPDSYRKTKMRINRRQPLRYDVSGRLNNKIIKLVVAIDTSGSLNKNHLDKIFVEIFEILKNKKYQLTIIECDAEIQKVYKALSPKDIDYNILGRGGTSFEPVIKFINSERSLYGSILIYFTDGFGEDSISKPKTLRNIWVVLDDVDNLSLENPYGDVVALDIND